MFIDATNGYPQAGRKPVREVRPKPIEERRKYFDTLRRTYPNQPRVDAAEVDALFDRTFHHESASTLLIENCPRNGQRSSRGSQAACGPADAQELPAGKLAASARRGAEADRGVSVNRFPPREIV